MIHDMLKELGPRSGRIHLSAQQYNTSEPILIDRPCVRLEGEVWAYSSDRTVCLKAITEHSSDCGGKAIS